jgi:hypothetical protein
MMSPGSKSSCRWGEGHQVDAVRSLMLSLVWQAAIDEGNEPAQQRIRRQLTLYTTLEQVGEALPSGKGLTDSVQEYT